MSQENLEIIRRIYAAMDHLIEWRGPREFADLAEPVYGLDGYRMVPERVIDAGDDQVLVFSREGGRGKGSGAGGRAARMQSYWERADALEAVGLSE